MELYPVAGNRGATLGCRTNQGGFRRCGISMVWATSVELRQGDCMVLAVGRAQNSGAFTRAQQVLFGLITSVASAVGYGASDSMGRDEVCIVLGHL